LIGANKLDKAISNHFQEAGGGVPPPNGEEVEVFQYSHQLTLSTASVPPTGMTFHSIQSNDIARR